MAETVHAGLAPALLEAKESAWNVPAEVISSVRHHLIIQDPGSTTYPSEVLVQASCCTWRSSWVNTETEDNTGMRAVVQRVTSATVSVEGQVVGQIGAGLLVLLGVARTDTENAVSYLASKIVNLRVFDDDRGRMNRSLLETGGEILVVSQFTLYGDTTKGRRPAYDEAAPAELARNLYDSFVAQVRSFNVVRVATGVFQAEMMVTLTNDGPVTLICESKV
ncbi:MAG TPA: D-aminoacyl-tRNA deacylase [Bryobacteraceae bacterium]|nr:D-aminoacyl-tRNA deacylase [Bryobacteraceae bacterium]